MLALTLAVVVAALLVMAGSRLHRPRRRDDEVARFLKAREMTTQWAREGVTRPVFADLDDAEERQRETADV
jgi:hypothetical protein